VGTVVVETGAGALVVGVVFFGAGLTGRTLSLGFFGTARCGGLVL
jgi:hypothetical protein